MQTDNQIMNILSSANDSDKVLLLQKIFIDRNQDLSKANLEFISKLTLSNDVAISFWAKKVLSLTNNAEGQVPDIEQNLPDQSMSLDLLFKRLSTSQSSFVTIEILKKIFEKRDPSSKELVTNYLKICNDNIVLSFLVKNLGIVFPEESTMNVLLPFMKHPDLRVVCNCIEGISKIKSPKITLLLVQLFEHNDHRIKATAAQMLVEQEPKMAKNVISQMLQSTSKPHFVIAACQAIKTIKDPVFLPALVHLATMPLFTDISIEVIEIIGGEAALGYLEPLCELDDPRMSLKVEETKKRIRLKIKVGEPLANVFEAGKGKLKELGKIIQQKMSTSSNGKAPVEKDSGKDIQLIGPAETYGHQIENEPFTRNPKIQSTFYLARLAGVPLVKVGKVLAAGFIGWYLLFSLNAKPSDPPAPPFAPVQNTSYGRTAVIDVKILDDSEHYFGTAELFLKVTSSINSRISVLLPLNVGKYAGQKHIQHTTPFLHDGANDETITFELLDDDKLEKEEIDRLVDAIGNGTQLACIAGKIYAFQNGVKFPQGGEDVAISFAKKTGKIILDEYSGTSYKSCGIAEYKVNENEQDRHRDANAIIIRDGNKAKIEMTVFYK